MLPVLSALPSRTVPVVTVALLAVNAALFTYGRVASGHAAPLPPTPLDVLAGMFIHGDWPRFVANTACLWIFGETVEDRTGRARFAAFCLACGMAAAVGHLWAQPGAPAVGIGASGIVAGVVAGHLSLFPRSRVLWVAPLPPPFAVVEASAVPLAALWAVFHVAIGSLALGGAVHAPPWSLNLAGHAAAAAVGALSIRVFTRGERMHPDWWHAVRSATGLPGRRERVRS